MQLLTSLLTTAEGLLSAGVILFVIVMGIYLHAHIKKLMNSEPGKTGW